MSFLSSKIKVTSRGQFQWWSIATYILFGLMAGSLMFSAFFVYNYTFRTLEDAHTIVLLNNDAVVNNVNIEQYNKAIAAIEKKSGSFGLSPATRNIFFFGTSPSSIPSESSPSSTVSTSTAYGPNQTIQ